MPWVNQNLGGPWPHPSLLALGRLLVISSHCMVQGNTIRGFHRLQNHLPHAIKNSPTYLYYAPEKHQGQTFFGRKVGRSEE